MEALKSYLERVNALLRVNFLFVIAFIIVLLSIAPCYILGQDVVIRVHDTFDSYFIWYKVLTDSNMLFAGQLDTVPIIMDGLPRLVYGSEFNVLLWLYVIFDPFTAYVFNLTAMRVVGFVGMYLLLKNHFLKEEKHIIIILGVAICFAILPLYPPGGLSVSSLPLALYAFLNIRANKATKTDWLILVLIPLYASIIFSYLFFLMMMGLLWLWDVLRYRDWGLKLFGATALMTVVFILVEYRLVLGVFFGEGFVSHRTEFELTGSSIPESLAKGLKNFIQGQYHAPSLHGLIIVFAVVFAVALILLSRIDHAKIPLLILGLGGIVGMFGLVILFGYDYTTRVMNTVLSLILFGSFYPLSVILTIGFIGCLILLLFLLTKRYETIRVSIRENYDSLKMLALLLGMSALFSLWYGLWSSILLVPWKEEFFILRTIQLSRIHWLHPLLWYILFAVSLSVINNTKSLNFKDIEFGKVIVLVLIIIQLVVLLPNNWEMAATPVDAHQRITYREFHAEDLFQQIEDDIGLSQESYRIINIGFHPTVSQYNGFYTLDGYFNNYPLEYKYRFRNIIGYELAKDTQLQDYFDNWGSRCYIMTAELGLDFFCTKDRGLVINNLELNITAMNEMNVSYVFSAVNITNYADSNLQFNGLYQHSESVWDIYLYELI